MNMILDASDFVEHALLRTDDAADVGIQTFRNIGRDEWLTMFRQENNVQQELGISAGHDDRVSQALLRPSRGDNTIRESLPTGYGRSPRRPTSTRGYSPRPRWGRAANRTMTS